MPHASLLVCVRGIPRCQLCSWQALLLVLFVASLVARLYLLQTSLPALFVSSFVASSVRGVSLVAWCESRYVDSEIKGNDMLKEGKEAM